jgi:hypothetical protein
MYVRVYISYIAYLKYVTAFEHGMIYERKIRKKKLDLSFIFS